METFYIYIFFLLFIGEQIAINVDGSGRKPNLDDEMTYGRGFMDRITLSSSKSVKVCSNAKYLVPQF